MPGPGAEETGAADPSCGVVFVATGAESYRALAARAAASVKAHAPALAVDLFTDRPLEGTVFDRVHLLEDPWFRSKIDGLLTSRFERTLYMDSDMLALADISDIFAVLERFDIAMVHDWYRNSALNHTFWRKELPSAFPQFNGGLIALRRNAMTTAFLHDWKAAVKAHDSGRDQITLREVVWDSDLRVAVMPEEYNLLYVQGVRTWTPDFPAPRIVHSPRFHREYDRFAGTADPVGELAGMAVAARLPDLLAGDRGLARMAGRDPVPAAKTARLGRILADLPRRLRGRIGRAFARGRADQK